MTECAEKLKDDQIIPFGRKILDDAYESHQQAVARGELVGGFAMIAEDIGRRYEINPNTGEPIPRYAYPL